MLYCEVLIGDSIRLKSDNSLKMPPVKPGCTI